MGRAASAVAEAGLTLYRQWKLWIEPERLRMRSAVRGWLKGCSPGSVVVEIGAGTGSRRLVINEIPDALYIGGDIAPTNNTTIVFDAATMPIAESSVDVVLAMEVLEHMPTPQGLIDEAARVLREDGLLIMTVPFMFGVHDFRDYYRYTPLGLEVMLSKAGFSLLETKVRGGTFVASTGLLRNLILNSIVGKPKDWRAQGTGKKVRWMVATIVLTPWTIVTWSAYGLDAILDRQTVSPPGYFFLCSRGSTAGGAASAASAPELD